MSEILSLDLRQQMTAERATAVPIHLLTFTQEGGDEPLRLTSDRTEVISVDPFYYGTFSRGHAFMWLPLSLVLPSEGEDVLPELRIQINLMHPKLLAAIRSVRTPADATIELVSSERPDYVERFQSGFRTNGAPWNGANATVVLGRWPIDVEPWPYVTMNPRTAPGLFR